MTINTLCIFGTRPEAIKMAPIIQKLQINPAFINKICVTGQHQQMLDPVLHLFEMKPDFDLRVMVDRQDLSSLMAKILTGLEGVFEHYQPDLVLVHGDTTTTLAASLAAYYHHTPVAHVEAGLRTGDLYAPWPEEANRKLTGALAAIHFAPTPLARLNLLREGVDPKTIHVTGNTVIDALFEVIKTMNEQPALAHRIQQQFPWLSSHSKMILVTGHRRENFGSGFEKICAALAEIARRFPDVKIIYPVHLNPSVQAPVKRLLHGIQNIHLIDPVDYLSFVYLMQSAYLILTDSGGVQEEAPSLGKPVLVMRSKTERPEGVEAGTVRLVGPDAEKIVANVEELLMNEQAYQHMSSSSNPYGDGKSAERIVQLILQRFGGQPLNPLQEDEVLFNLSLT